MPKEKAVTLKVNGLESRKKVRTSPKPSMEKTLLDSRRRGRGSSIPPAWTGEGFPRGSNPPNWLRSSVLIRDSGLGGLIVPIQASLRMTKDSRDRRQKALPDLWPDRPEEKFGRRSRRIGRSSACTRIRSFKHDGPRASVYQDPGTTRSLIQLEPRNSTGVPSSFSRGPGGRRLALPPPAAIVIAVGSRSAFLPAHSFHADEPADRRLGSSSLCRRRDLRSSIR